MATYYHYSGIKLAPDSIIEPGNYGRMVRRYLHDGQPGNGWKMAVELVFESVRIAMDNTLPGRLDSCYAFETLEHARAAGVELNAHFNLLYEVELVDSTARIHRADMGLINASFRSEPQRMFWDKVHDAARSYWAGSAAILPELLTSSALKIRKVVS